MILDFEYIPHLCPSFERSTAEHPVWWTDGL